MEEDRGKRQVLLSQTREILGRVIQYFEQEKQNKGPLLGVSQVLEKGAQALGLGLSTIKRIKKETHLEATRQKPKFSTPGKKRPDKSMKLDNFDADAIRRHIYAL